MGKAQRREPKRQGVAWPSQNNSPKAKPTEVIVEREGVY
jgi:hypothetical protein